MRILKKIFWIFCAAALLADAFAMKAWAEPEAPEIEIDEGNIYTGMDKTYKDGYRPKVENDTAHMVVPLIYANGLKNDALKVSLNLGSGTDIPFASENYEKDVSLSQEKINNSQETAPCYLAVFDLELKSDRKNGEYPVILTVQAENTDGSPIHKEFTVKVAIRDEKPPATEPSSEEPSTEEPSTEPSTEEPSTKDPSKDPSKEEPTTEPSGKEPSKEEPATEPPTKDSGEDLTGAVDVTGPSGGGSGGASSGGGGGSEAPTFAPKMIVQSCTSSKEDIQAGDEVTLDITLRNTSSSESVRNMTVTIGDEGEFLSLLSPTDTIYVDSVPAGQTCVVSYKYKILASAAPGAYGLTVSMDYADSKAASQSASGKIRMMVAQAVKMEFDAPVLDGEVQVGDVVNVQMQAMNLGRGTVYNVRAVIEADGLVPEGTLFIGNVEAGKTASGSTKVNISGLSGANLYGRTEGAVTCYYEDENGKEYEKKMNISTTIKTPFSNKEETETDDTGQWWTVMAVIAGILAVFVVTVILKSIKRNRKEEAEEEIK